MGKIKEHLDSYMHVYDNGTTARLYATPWDRNTVADGYWQTVNTIQPLINRDVYLADCIEELSSRAAKYEPGANITFTDMPDGTTQINASMAFSLRGSNGIAIDGNNIYLSGGTIDASFKFQNLSANNLSATNAQIDNLSTTNETATLFVSTDAKITNMTATNLTSDSAFVNNLSAGNISSRNFSGINISANKFSSNSAQFNDISSKNFSANKFSAVSGSFTNLSATNMTATNLSSTNLTSTTVNITSLSATDLSSTNISTKNVSANNVSSTNLSARYLSGTSFIVDTRITTKNANISSLNVGSDFNVYSAAENTKYSLSSTLSKLNEMTLDDGRVIIEMGPYQSRTSSWYDVQDFWRYGNRTVAGNWWCMNSYRNGQAGGMKPWCEDILAGGTEADDTHEPAFRANQYARNVDITQYIDAGYNDFIIRCGNTLKYTTASVGGENCMYIGNGVSINVYKLKPYKTYKFSFIKMMGGNLFAGFDCINFIAKEAKNIFFYNVNPTPLHWITDGDWSNNNGSIRYNNAWYKPRMYPIRANTVNSNNKFIMFNKQYNVLTGYQLENGTGIEVAVPILGDSLAYKFQQFEYGITRDSDILNETLYCVSSNQTTQVTTSWSEAYSAGMFVSGNYLNKNMLSYLDIEYKNRNPGSIALHKYFKPNDVIELYNNGNVEFMCTSDTNGENVYIYFLNTNTEQPEH